MADPLSSLIRPDRGPSLPAFDRFAPPPPRNVVAGRDRGPHRARRRRHRPARTRRLDRRATPSPPAPGLRPRVDGADAAGGRDRAAAAGPAPLRRRRHRPRDQPRGEVGLRRRSIELASPRAARPAAARVVEEFIWDGDADAPSRKVYPLLGLPRAGRVARTRASVPTDGGRRSRARAVDGRRRPQSLRRALPGPGPRRRPARRAPRPLHAALARRLDEILARIEQDLARSADRGRPAAWRSCTRCCRPAGSTAIPGGSPPCASSAGTSAAPATASGASATRGSPSRTAVAWCAASSSASRRPPAGRSQPGRATTSDAPATARPTSCCAQARRSWLRGQRCPSLTRRRRCRCTTGPGGLDQRARVRLVLSQPPVRWTSERLSFAYLARPSCWARSGRRRCPSSGSSAQPPGAGVGSQAAALRRVRCLASRPSWRPTRRVVVLLDPGGPGASWRACWVASGRLSADQRAAGRGRRAIGGALEFVPPGGATPGRPRTRGACRRSARRRSRMRRLPPGGRRAGRDRDRGRRCSRRAASRPAASGCWARCSSASIGLATSRDSSGRRTFPESEARGERALDALGYMADRQLPVGRDPAEAPAGRRDRARAAGRRSAAGAERGRQPSRRRGPEATGLGRASRTATCRADAGPIAPAATFGDRRTT